MAPKSLHGKTRRRGKCKFRAEKGKRGRPELFSSEMFHQQSLGLDVQAEALRQSNNTVLALHAALLDAQRANEALANSFDINNNHFGKEIRHVIRQSETSRTKVRTRTQ